MTCIVGVVHGNGDIYMGGDSAVISEESYALDLDATGKVFKKPSYIVGFCGGGRSEQLLRYSFEMPKYEGQDPHEFICRDFIKTLRQCFKEGGFLKSKIEVEEWGMSGAFIVGFQSRLFVVESDFAVWESMHPWTAIGCAMDIALGSLYSTEGKPPRVRVNNALLAAERHSAGVRQPFTIEVLKAKKKKE